MSARRFSGDLLFVNRSGFLDADVTGSWKGLGYEMRLDGAGLTHASLAVSKASPYIDFRSSSRLCAPGPCGYFRIHANVSFFGFSYGPDFNILRRTDGKYDVEVPLASDSVLADGQCDTWWWGGHGCAM
jgi:hypothetical protein